MKKRLLALMLSMALCVEGPVTAWGMGENSAATESETFGEAETTGESMDANPPEADFSAEEQSEEISSEENLEKEVQNGEENISDPGTEVENNLTDEQVEDTEEVELFTEEVSDFTYQIKNDQVYITKWSGSEADLVIPDTIEEKPVVEIASGAFENAEHLETLVLPDQNVYLRKNAFTGCVNLRQVTIQQDLKDIDESTFEGCDSLTTIRLGQAVSNLVRGRDGKIYGPALEEILVEDGNPYLESIQGVLYQQADAESGALRTLLYYPLNHPAEEYTVEEGTQVLSRYAIAGSVNLRKLTLCSSIQEWDRSIINMPVLEELVLEEGVAYTKYWDLMEACPELKILDIRTDDVRMSALGDFPILDEIRLGKNVLKENLLPSSWGSQTKSYVVEEGNSSYQVYGGALCDYEGTLLFYPAGSEDTTYQIPDGITTIGESAFKSSNHLTTVTVGDQVQEIKDQAFERCMGLTSIQLDGNLRVMGDSVFASCEALETFSLESQEEDFELGSWILSRCYSLSSVYFDVKTKVEMSTFEDVTGIKLLELGSQVEGVDIDTVTSIQHFIVDEKNPYLKADQEMLLDKAGKRVIMYAASNPQTSCQIPEGVETVGERSFCSSRNLEEVQLPSTLTAIGDEAFRVCSGLLNITIPEGTKSVGSYAFDDCDNMARADIPKSVESIGDSAFSCIIWGYQDTAAEAYAREYNLIFVDKASFEEEDKPDSGDFPESSWDGEKTEEITPQGKTYVIETAAQLAWVSQEVADGNKFAGCRLKLAADIDLNNQPWTPIGNGSSSFYGSFDGQGHTIRNLQMNQELQKGHKFGLFGSVKARAVGQDIYIRNLTIEDAQMDYGDDQGILAGEVNCDLSANLVIENCHTSGSVKGGTVSGLIGVVYGGATGSQITITDCTSKAEIVTSGNGGGLIGRISTFSGTNNGSIVVKECKFQGSTGSTGRYGKPAGIVSGISPDGTVAEIRLERCVNEADINGSSSVNLGGIVCETGDRAPIVIERCVNKGNVHGGYYTGGIAGGISGSTTISQCYNTGEIGYAYLGGAMGGICGSSGGTIVDCYNDGEILHTSAMDYNGGITGENNGVIENCYSIGTLPGTGNTSVDVSRPGAISCINNKEIRHCYFNLDELPQQWLIAKVYCEDQPREVFTSEDGKRIESGGLSTGAMKISDSYTGWDFQNVWELDSKYAYGYPVLSGIKDLIDEHPDNEEHSDKRKTKELKVTVVGKMQPGDKKEPLLEGVTVTYGTATAVTNSKGVAVLTSDGKSSSFQVTKEDYVTYTREDFKFPRNKEYRVRLFKKGEVTPYDLGSVVMDYNANQYELLAEKKEINSIYKDTEFTLKAVPAISGGNIGSYRLVQGETVIAQSADGLFTVKNGQFKPTKKSSSGKRPVVEIEVLDQNGEVQTSTTINLEVVHEEENESSFTFGKGLSITVDKSVPIFGGTELSMSSFDLPLYFVIEPEDDKLTCKLGVNLLKADLRDPEKTKTFATCINMDFLDGDSLLEKRNAYLKMMKGSASKKDLKVLQNPSITFNVYGYAQGEFPSNDKVAGKLFAEVSINWSGETQAGVFVLAGDLTGKVGADGSFVLDTVELDQWKGQVDVDGSVSLNIFGGVGAAYLASVGVYGEAEFGLNTTVLPWERSGFNNIYVEGEIGVMGRLLGHTAKYSLIDKKHYLYNKDASTDRSARRGGSLENSLADYEGYERIGRDSYDSDSVWEGEKKARVNSSQSTLLQNGYPEMAPQIFTCGEDTVMVFVNDYGSGREEDDKSALFYSVYEGSNNNWSTPKLVADNGTADFNPKVASDGTNAWVVWNDASGSLQGAETIEEVAAKMEVAVAQYDSETHSFQTQEALTSNSECEITPQITVASGEPVVSWTVNEDKNFWKTSGINKVYTALRDQGGWSVKEIVAPKGAVTGEALGSMDGVPYYAYIVDTDGNLENGEGQSGYLLNIQTGSQTQLEGAQVSNVQFGNVGGQDQVLWTDAEGTLYARNQAEETLVNSFEQGGIHGVVRQVIQGPDGKAAILFTQNGENCSNAYVAYYDGETKTWSEISQITDASAYVEQIQGFFVDGKLVLTYNQRKIDINNEQDLGTNNLVGKWIQQDKTELKVENVLFWQKDVRAGEVLPLTVDVKNQGDKTCTTETLKITCENKTVLEEDFQESIAAGETVSIPVNLTLPQEMKKADYVVEIKEKGSSQSSASSLKQTITLGSANFSADAVTYRNGELYTVALTVFNEGYQEGSCKAIFYDMDDPEKIYATQTVPNLKPDEVWNTTVDFLPEDVNYSSFKKIGIRVESPEEPEESRYDNETSAALYWDSQTRPEKIQLSDASLVLKPGEAKKLQATVLPAEADQTILWSSSKPEVVSVRGDGEVQAVASQGSAVITASTADESIHASCKVTIEKKVVEKPGTPKLSPVEEIDYQTLKIAWSAAKSAEGYLVYRKEEGKWVKVADVAADVTSWTDEGLDTGTSYTYTVKAYRDTDDGLLYGDYDTEGITGKPTLGTAKLGKASSASYNQVKITWSAVPGATGYYVFRKSGSSWKNLTSVKDTGYTDAGLSTGTSYTYTVRAYREVNGKEVLGGYDNKGIAGKPALDTVKLGKASSVSYSQVKVTWSAVPGATGYYVFRKSGSSWKTLKTVKTTNYTDTGLTTNTSYTYTVRAYRTVNGKNILGGYDNKGITGKPVLGTVKLGRVYSNDYNKVKITWASLSGATGYRVYRKSGDSWKLLKQLGKTNYYVDTGLTTGTSYTYTVRAYRKVGGKTYWGSYSSAGITGKPTLATPKLGKVSSSSKGLTVTWGTASGSTGYIVYRKTAGSSWTKLAVVTGATKSSYVDAKATKNTKYIYTVKAYRKVGSKHVYSSYDATGIAGTRK